MGFTDAQATNTRPLRFYTLPFAQGLSDRGSTNTGFYNIAFMFILYNHGRTATFAVAARALFEILMTLSIGVDGNCARAEICLGVEHHTALHYLQYRSSCLY